MERDKKAYSKRSSMYWFISHMATMAGAGPSQSKEPGTPGLPQAVRSPSTWTIFHCLPRHIKGVEAEVEQLGLKLELIWEAGIVGSHSEIHCLTRASSPPNSFQDLSSKNFSFCSFKVSVLLSYWAWNSFHTLSPMALHSLCLQSESTLGIAACRFLFKH